MADYYDLGSYVRTVTTTSPEAQRWFERGLVWCYGFHHEEAVRCFERAIEADPGCAMAHWGIAYALGPNYNKPWEAFDEFELTEGLARANAAVRAATEHAAGASPVERALIAALAERYPTAMPVDDCSPWNDAYAVAMRAVYAEFPDDPDVAALFAEALMNRTPWQLWDIEAGEPADGADTLEILAVLERAMAADAASGRAGHPGVLHFYVHAMEMSPHPERALHAADALRDLVPDAGHLRHMATHIDVLCGFYRDVIVTNELAIAADRKFLEREGPLNFYTLYRCHNYHFKLYGAMFLGDPGAALEAADELAATLGEDLLRTTSPPMADWLEGFVSMRLHALIRFGLWQDIIAAPLPLDPELYCVTTAMLHYAKGVAHAALGEIAAAEDHERLFREAQARVPVIAHDLQQHVRGHPRRRRARCWPARSPTAGASSTKRSPTCAGRWSWTTHCRTMSRGAGCSRRATRSARSSSSRGGSPTPRRSTGPTSASTAASAGHASTPRTCGACTATTNACAASARPPRPSSWARVCDSPRRAPPCPSEPPASAAGRRCLPRPDEPGHLVARKGVVSLGSWRLQGPGLVRCCRWMRLRWPRKRQLQHADRLAAVRDRGEQARLVTATLHHDRLARTRSAVQRADQPDALGRFPDPAFACPSRSRRDRGGSARAR